jgi:hypothetical protein
MRCSTVLLCCWHAGQVGESAFPMWWGCLAREACSILICMRMLTAFLGSGVIRVKYLFDMAVGSVFFIRSYLGNACHSFCVHHLSFSPYSYFIADLLRGSVFFRSCGSSSCSLLSSVIAFFASSSACSFPSTPL